MTDWWDDGGDRIAFGRGSKAYAAINREGSSPTRTFQTSLPAGDHCDVRSGKGVTVDGSGRFTAALGANTALAPHADARNCDGGAVPDPDPVASGVSFAVNATTGWGQNVHVTGNRPELGNRNPDSALEPDPAACPVRKPDVELPEGTSFEDKYVRKDESGNVTWESGADRTATVTSTRITLNDTRRGRRSPPPRCPAAPSPRRAALAE